MAECPYCKKELLPTVSCYGVFIKHDYDIDDFIDYDSGKLISRLYYPYDEYECKCPYCGKTFRGFEHYSCTDDSAMSLEEYEKRNRTSAQSR